MTEYKDIKNNTFKLIQRKNEASNNENSYTEEEIIAALYKIFAGK